jgi:CubicO group peptidase (beta-lactamase class C family)
MIDDALEYARKHQLHALVVARAGEIVAEEYGEGYAAQIAHPLYSGTKSFWGITAVVASRDGLLHLDERVADTVHQWDEDRWKRQVTLRQLLQLTSGFGFGGLGSSVPTHEKALETPLRDAPGTKFTYGGIPLQVFGAVLSRKLASNPQLAPCVKTPHEYLQTRVLDPAGVRVERWRALADGSYPLPTGAFATARQWCGFGSFVAERKEEFGECFAGSQINPRYGLAFWLGTARAPAGLFYASGAGGQGMYVLPLQKLVMVHFGNSRSFSHQAFLARFFR